MKFKIKFSPEIEIMVLPAPAIISFQNFRSQSPSWGFLGRAILFKKFFPLKKYLHKQLVWVIYFLAVLHAPKNSTGARLCNSKKYFVFAWKLSGLFFWRAFVPAKGEGEGARQNPLSMLGH